MDPEISKGGVVGILQNRCGQVSVPNNGQVALKKKKEGEMIKFSTV